jgi:hypothetical protein
MLLGAALSVILTYPAAMLVGLVWVFPLADGLPDPTAPMARFFLEGLRGNREAAVAALDSNTRDYAWRDPDFSALRPGMFAHFGETNEGLRWLEHLLGRGYINYPALAQHDPFLKNLREDPRFTELVAELKPKWEAFEF